MSKVLVTIPKDLLTEVDQTTKELKTNRSQFFRQAIVKYLHEIKQKKFEALMAEGYQEMAQEDIFDAQAFLGATASLAEQENV
ncbi:MAG TPA: ribbon-helix-helix protein, CopG family [Syntrophaceae bacterium]|nr:ribbon-helix-helix protein, CopG family [Syntrophaceae bacterium]